MERVDSLTPRDGILVQRLSKSLDLSLPPLDRKIARTTLRMRGKML